MKKKIVAAVMAAAMVTSLVACTNGQVEPEVTPTTPVDTVVDGDGETTNTQVNTGSADAIEALIAATEGTVELTVWCSELESYQTTMAEVVEEFKATYPDVDFNIKIGAESEANCKDDVLKDVETAADVFVFADDQLNELVQAGALQAVTTTYTYNPLETNTAGTVNAASINDVLYAYPFIASNGYFLYYDSSILSEEDVATWEGLVAACEAAGKKVGFDFGNIWYTYGFFSGAGLTATLAEDGKNTVCDWNCEKGLAVATAISALAQSDAFISIGNADAVGKAKDGELVAFVDGTWDAIAFQEAYGDGYAATKLPTYDLDGVATPTGSFAGYKFVGVNSFSKNVGWSMLLAEFITSEASQLKFGENCQEGPANIVAASKISSPALAALAAQSENATLQRVGGNFWASGNTLGQAIFSGSADLAGDLETAVAGITAPVE